MSLTVDLPFVNIYIEIFFLPPGQKVMILREERSCPGASQIVQWWITTI